MRIKCDECGSGQVYFRVKSKTFQCQKCGNAFARQGKKELNLDAKDGRKMGLENIVEQLDK